MPKVKISEYSQTAANNTDINSINLAEGMLPSDVNNAIRELMKQLKDFQVGAQGDGATFSSLNLTTTALTVPNGGTGATSFTSGALLKGAGTSAIAPATAGTDYPGLASTNTFTASQIFSGSSSVAGIKIFDVLEGATISATAATGTINYDVTTQAVLYYTSNASANWTLNLRGSSGTSLDTLMATGESLTISFLVTNGATAYYQSAFQVDGNAVTPKWQGGSAPTSGNASSIDVYTITVIKTGSATFTALASQTKFA